MEDFTHFNEKGRVYRPLSVESDYSFHRNARLPAESVQLAP